MKPIIPLLSGVCFFLLSACSPKLAFVDLSPRTSAIPKKINKPITIYLENLKDTVIVQGDVMHRLTVTQFRKTIENALTKVFLTSFSEVRFSNTLPLEGVVLHVYSIEPFWKITKTEESYDSNGNRRTVYYGSAATLMRTTLFYNNQGISRVDQSIVGNASVKSSSFRTQKTFAAGLTNAIEETFEFLVVTAEAYNKIND